MTEGTNDAFMPFISMGLVFLLIGIDVIFYLCKKKNVVYVLSMFVLTFGTLVSIINFTYCFTSNAFGNNTSTVIMLNTASLVIYVAVGIFGILYNKGYFQKEP